MSEKFYEFNDEYTATKRHIQLRRLGYRPFSIFRTARGTWAFWIN